MEEKRIIIPRPYRRKKIQNPRQSRDYAWFLGVMAGDGSSTYGDNTTNNAIRLTVTSEEFRNEFARKGQELFGLEARGYKIFISEINPNWKDTYYAGFNSANLVDLLGDFRSDKWVDTIKNKHLWVTDKQGFIWGFLSGYFDSEGSVSNPYKLRRKAKNGYETRIRFATAYRNAAEFTVNLLNRVGIKSYIEKSASKREGISSVTFTKLEYMKRFSENVYSFVQEKEERLKFYRNTKLVTGPSLDVIEAYHLTMKLRKETGFGSRKLAKHPLLEKYNLSHTTINNWIYAGNNPTINGRHYTYFSLVD